MTDRFLVARAQGGDHAAFSALVVAHRRMVYGICFRMTGQADDADDLAHEAFVEAFLKLGTLRDLEQFGGWLRTLALNLCRMWLRGRKAQGEELTEDLPAELPAESDALACRVTGGLARLAASQRITLVLHYLEGLSCDEVATFLDVPVGTVMSRLHRGRAALKQVVDNMPLEEIPMMPDDEFLKDVDAEIAVLLAIFGDDQGAAERLTMLLAHAPERLARLVAQAGDAKTLANLVRLLRHLGAPGIEIVLNVALTEEPAARQHAVQVLREFLARLPQNEAGTGNGGGAVLAYLLFDGIIRSTAHAVNKAGVLVELIDVNTDHQTALLLRNVLLCYPDAALPALLLRFWPAAEMPGYPVNVPVLTTLAAMGTRFVAALLESFSSGDTGRQVVALAGFESFAQWRNARGKVSHRFPQRYSESITPEHLDAVVVDAAVTRVAALLDDPRGEIRTRAVRVLGLLHRAEYRLALERLASEGDTATRVAVLRALADIGATESAPVLCTAAALDRKQPERVAAIEALGRIGISEAAPVLIDLIEDPELPVRRVAVLALGGIGGEVARAAVERVMHSPDKALIRTAAKVLHTSPHFRLQPKQAIETPQQDRHLQQRLLGEEPQADYNQLYCYNSVHAAIAELPRIRPYKERELTRYIARACIDYSSTRRALIEQNLMRRAAGVYELTEQGQAIWRVEHFIQQYYYVDRKISVEVE